MFLCWVIVSKPDSSAFNVDFVCTVHTLVYMYVTNSVAGSAGTCIAHHYYRHMRLLSCPNPSPSLSKYVQQWDYTWAMPTEREVWPLGLGTKESPRCTAYIWLPHSHSPHNALHSPSVWGKLRVRCCLCITQHIMHKEGNFFILGMNSQFIIIRFSQLKPVLLYAHILHCQIHFFPFGIGIASGQLSL